MGLSNKTLIATPYSVGGPIPAGHGRPMHRSNKPQWTPTCTNTCALSFPLGAPKPPARNGGATPINHLDWHIDKDEVSYRENGRYSLPLLSTVFYPHVSCAGGELLVADNPPVTQEQTGPPPHFRSVISVPPVLNRLVIFSPGILHRINPLEGERYSVAVNLWSHEPLTTQESAPPA